MKIKLAPNDIEALRDMGLETAVLSDETVVGVFAMPDDAKDFAVSLNKRYGTKMFAVRKLPRCDR